MTPQAFTKKMRKIYNADDFATSLNMADDLVAQCLIELGYGTGVRIFQDLYQWHR